MSNLISLDQLHPNLSIILTTPANLVGADLGNWQKYCTQAIGPMVEPNLKLEWFWVNSDLTSVLIDDIRTQIAQLQYGVSQTNYRLVVILAADQISIQVQNTLLKILEEPPIRTTIILATPNPASLIETILSRCQIIALKSTFTPLIANADLAQDTATLTKFSLQPTKFSFGQLSLLASKYKDKTAAKILVSTWLNSLVPTLATATVSQLKLAMASLKIHDWLNQNLSPALVLEHIWFEFKKLA